jgi:hypothetical protein
LPEALYLQGKALQQLLRTDVARDRFLEARSEAEKMGARRILWRILLALSELEEGPSRAGELRREARRLIATIADHIDQGDLQSSFLAQPDVQAAIAAG